MSQGPEAPRPFEDPVPPPELDELWAEAPELRTGEIWNRLQARLASEPRDTAPRRLVPLSLPRAIPVGRTGRQVAALAAGLLVAGGLAAGLVLGTTGTASAGFAEDVADLGDQTQAALADGVIDADELAALQAAADALSAQLDDGEDLGELSVQELDTVIATLVAVRSALVEAGMGGGPAAGSTLSELATVGSAVRLERAARATDALVVALPAQTNSPHVSQLIDAADLPVTVTAGDAGTVQFDVQDGDIVIGEVSPADGWEAEIVQAKDDKAKVRFENGDEAIQVRADLVDGDLRIKTIVDDGDDAEGALTDEEDDDEGDDGESETAAVDGVHSFQAGDAALVTLELADGVLSVQNVDVEPGWTLDGSIDDEDDEDEIKLRFFNEDAEVLFKAELDDGEIEVKVTTQSLDGDAQSLNEDGDDDDDDGKRPMRMPIGEGLEHTFDVPGGSIDIEATLEEISIVEVHPDDGWEIHINRVSGRAARVELWNDDGSRVRLKIELVGDELLVKIEEIQTGRNGDGSEIESKGEGGDNGHGLGRPDEDDDDEGPGRSGEARDRDDDLGELQLGGGDDDDHEGEDDGKDGHEDGGITEAGDD